MKSVYVGNLPYATTEAELKELFEQHGKVFGAKIKTDRDTGRPLGYGFVLLAVAMLWLVRRSFRDEPESGGDGER